MSIYKKLQKNKALADKLSCKTDSVYINTGVITLNLLHSGKVDGGITKGAMNQISADSSLGKSFIGLSTLKNSQRMGMQCVVIDAEKSFDYKWAENIGIDISEEKLVVIRDCNIISIKQAIQVIIDGMTREERQNVFILFDSWGTLVSQVVLDKAGKGSETKDMSLPVWKNELANIMKESDCTYYVINHVYDNTGGFGDPLKIPGGKRLYFNSESIVLGCSKAKDKEQEEITGAIVTAMTQKGRKAVERSKLKYRIKHEGGLDVFYGLLPDALDHGCVVKPSNGYYSRQHIKDDKKWREKQIYCSDFWMDIFANTDFKDYLETKYTFKGRKIDVSDDSVFDTLTSFGDNTKFIETKEINED
jgi:RecA/RadA recombinase